MKGMNRDIIKHRALPMKRLCHSLLLAGSLLLLAACHSTIAPSVDEEVGSCPQKVKIMATVSDFGGTSTDTRAVISDTTEDKSFGVQTKPAVGNEKEIQDIFLFVVPQGATEVSEVRYYYKEGPAGITADIAKSKFDVVGDDVIMALELLPGQYNFLTVANSAALRTMPKDQLTLANLKKLECANITFVATTDKADAEAFKDFPIFGHQGIVVPATQQEAPLEPVIDMERVFARIDLTLTTVDKDNNYFKVHDRDKEAKSRRPEDYRLVSLEVLAADNEGKAYPYTILPIGSDEYAEFSALPRTYTHSRIATMTIGSKPTAVASWGDGKKYTAGAFDTKVNGGAKGGLAKLRKQSLLFRSAESETAGHLYLPSFFTYQNTPTVNLQLTFKNHIDGKLYLYRIPVKNGEDKLAQLQPYSIRRNTIYAIDLAFYGGEIVSLTSGVKVLPWIVTDQYFEIDPKAGADKPLIPGDKPVEETPSDNTND